MTKKFFGIIFLLVLVIASCKKNTTEETPAGFVWPEGTGEYAPNTLGSTFTFETSTTTPVVTDSFTYTVTKDTTIDALKYKKLESNKPVLASTYYCNYNAGVRTEITYNTSTNGISIPVIKQTVLKDNVPVTNNWVEGLNVNVPGIPVAIPVTFTYTIMQKDFTKTILGKDYANTIYVKQVASLPGGIALPPGTPSTVQVDNNFSKGVGLSQRDLPNTSIKIKRYNVIK
jgi:hypothetical protein